MPGSRTQRSTTTRDRHRAALRRGQPPCALCHQDIDYTLPHLDPGEFVVDHIIPLARGGANELANCQPAHRACNEAKGDKLPEEMAAEAAAQAALAGPRTYVTYRTW